MPQSAQETCASLCRLATVLGELADAMKTGDLDAMLRVEPQLASLTAALTSSTDSTEADVLRPALLEARHALQRAERLGAGLQAFIACSLAAQGRHGSYARYGAAPASVDAHVLTARG